MKKAMSAWLCAAAVSGAQADGPKAPTQCSDKQTQTVSAVHGLIGCQDIRAIEVPMIFAQSSPPYTSQVSRGGSVNTHTNASPFTGSITPLHSSQFGNGAIATGILGTTDRA